MSFILDAIAKSEQERQQQEVPGAQVLALPAGSLQQPRRALPYLLVGALILNAAVLVMWMQSGQTWLNWSSPTQIENMDRRNERAIVPGNASSAEHTTSANTSETAAGIVDGPDTVQSNPAAMATSGGTASVGVTASATASDVIAEIDYVKPMNESRTERQSATPANTGETAAGLVRGPEIEQSDTAVTATNEDTTAWIRIGPDMLSNKTHSGQRAEPVQGTQDTDAMARKVSSLSELPRAVRNDLPTVVFSGHLYSSDPASSLVFVDGGRPVVRGRQIARELFLHEITPTGVIVEFRGYLIDVGVLQNWTLN